MIGREYRIAWRTKKNVRIILVDDIFERGIYTIFSLEVSHPSFTRAYREPKPGPGSRLASEDH